MDMPLCTSSIGPSRFLDTERIGQVCCRKPVSLSGSDSPQKAGENYSFHYDNLSLFNIYSNLFLLISYYGPQMLEQPNPWAETFIWPQLKTHEMPKFPLFWKRLLLVLSSNTGSASQDFFLTQCTSACLPSLKSTVNLTHTLQWHRFRLSIHFCVPII